MRRGYMTGRRWRAASAMIGARCAAMNMSAITVSPPPGRSLIAAMTRSLAVVAHRRLPPPDPKGRGGGAERWKVARRRSLWIVHDRNPRHGGRGFLEQLEPFAGHG